MQQFWRFFIYIIICYTLAALLMASLPPLIIPIQIAYRGGIIFAVLGLLPFLALQGLANKLALGYDIKFTKFIYTVILGLSIGITILASLITILISLQIRCVTSNVNTTHLSSVIVKGLLTGITVSVIEETFFRGALFTAIRRHNHNAASAIIWSSILYAILHFFQLPDISTNKIEIANIVYSVIKAIYAIFQIHNLDALIALLSAGIFLALIREHAKHLGWNIGIHAGWILIIKISHIYTDVNVNSTWINLVSNYDGITGWLAAIWLGILALSYKIFLV